MKIKSFLAYSICASIMLTGCSTMSNTNKGMIIGGTSGAAVGAGVGALIAKNGKGAAIGAAIGAGVGTGAGALIGKKMDKKRAELAAIEAAKVEAVTDANNLQALRVTFDSGILFKTGSSNLSDASKSSLKEFASKMIDLPDTDFVIQGHTDNTGSRTTNESLSIARANAVCSYLTGYQISRSRITTEGCAFDFPVATNDTEAGRTQNRRVEIYIYANEAMIKKAENGTL